MHYFFHRKKMKSTSKYIYQTLFVDGKNSDVTISALDKDWHLHKVYLCQVRKILSTLNRTQRKV